MEQLYKTFNHTPKVVTVQFSVHTLQPDFIFTVKAPIKYAPGWHLNESNINRYSFQCKSEKSYVYGYENPDFFPVCKKDHKKFARFTFTFQPNQILIDYALWSRGSNAIINQTRIMKVKPHVVCIIMSGFIETVSIFSQDVENPVKCAEGCNKCMANGAEDCMECAAGYKSVDVPNGGMICNKPFSAINIILIIVLISAVIFAGRYFLGSPRVEKEYKCKNHGIPGTHIVQPCGHLLCDYCVTPIKAHGKAFACPSCLEDAKALLKLKDESNSKFKKQ